MADRIDLDTCTMTDSNMTQVERPTTLERAEFADEPGGVKSDGCTVPTVLTTKEVAKLLRVSPDTARKMFKCGELEAIKAGREWRIRREYVLAYLADGGLESRARLSAEGSGLATPEGADGEENEAGNHRRGRAFEDVWKRYEGMFDFFLMFEVAIAVNISTEVFNFLVLRWVAAVMVLLMLFVAVRAYRICGQEAGRRA